MVVLMETFVLDFADMVAIFLRTFHLWYNHYIINCAYCIWNDEFVTVQIKGNWSHMSCSLPHRKYSLQTRLVHKYYPHTSLFSLDPDELNLHINGPKLWSPSTRICLGAGRYPLVLALQPVPGLQQGSHDEGFQDLAYWLALSSWLPPLTCEVHHCLLETLTERH